MLRPDGIGPVRFGTPQDQALSALSDAFLNGSAPTDRLCNGRTMQIVAWAELEVAFDAGRFGGYRLRPVKAGGGPALNLRTPEGIGLGATAAELRAAYHDAVAFSGAAGIWSWAVGASSGLHGTLTGAPDQGGTVATIEAGTACPAA